jgi:hypothetical protein
LKADSSIKLVAASMISSDEDSNSDASTDALLTSDSEEEEVVDESLSESDGEQDHGSWTSVTCGQDARPADLPPFLGTTGINPEVELPEDGQDSTAFFLSLFVTDQLIAGLQKWTNAKARYEVSCHEAAGDQGDLPPKLKKWTECTEEEIRKLLGMMLYMGLNPLPRLRMYWSTDPLFYRPYFHQPHSLSRNRFQALLSFLRCYDAENMDAADELHKIRPFLEIVQTACSSVYTPECEVSVDETLVMYRGRVAIRQYITSKKAKYGLKMYCLTEASSGYLYKFLIHSSAAQHAHFADGLDCGQLSMSEKTVVELMRDLLGHGRHVFCDNWFGSARLAQFLLERRTLLTCTVRKDRGPPKELQAQPTPTPGHKFMRKGCILAVKVSDRKTSCAKTVYLLDTKLTAGCAQKTRIGKQGTEQHFRQVASVAAYNKGMGGVDRLDAALSPYSSNRRTYKWTHKLLFHFLLVLVHNSFVVQSKAGGEKTDFLQFIAAAVRSLVETTGRGRARAIVQPAGVGRVAPVQRHSPKRFLPTATQPRPSKRCRYCKSQGVEKKTVFTCAACPGSPPLCAAPCFERWHSG